jgi:matrixin
MRMRFFVVVLACLIVATIVLPSQGVAVRPENPSKGHARYEIPPGHARVAIPPHAIEVAPGIFNLGTAIDRGRIVEGYAIITIGKKRYAKPVCNGDGVCDPGEKKNCRDCQGVVDEEPDASTCNEFTNGAKWKSVENYWVNASNIRGLDQELVLKNVIYDIEKWEDAADAEIFGSGNKTEIALTADLDSPDGENEVYFADVDSPGAVAITIVWGIFRGPPSRRELVEWDQVYDDVDYLWSMGCDGDNCTTEMDFESIATHELGHSIGLNDLYDDKCSDQTMFGYVNFGETKKRSLESGDIFGAYELYQ